MGWLLRDLAAGLEQGRPDKVLPMRQSRRKPILTALMLCLALCAGVAQAASGLRMEQPWARASLSGVKNAIVFGTLVNGGAAALSIVSGSTPVASRVEFHIHAMNG